MPRKPAPLITAINGRIRRSRTTAIQTYY